MQQAIRWRRKRPATWQVVLARWFLAIAVVVTLSPSTSGSERIVRAQNRGPDELSAGRTIADDDTHPEHATADDGAPIVLPQERPASARPLFEPAIGPAVSSQPPATDDETPVQTEVPPAVPVAAAAARAEEMPEDEPLPAAYLPAPATGNRRAPFPRPISQAAASCPAD